MERVEVFDGFHAGFERELFSQRVRSPNMPRPNASRKNENAFVHCTDDANRNVKNFSRNRQWFFLFSPNFIFLKKYLGLFRSNMTGYLRST